VLCVVYCVLCIVCCVLCIVYCVLCNDFLLMRDMMCIVYYVLCIVYCVLTFCRCAMCTVNSFVMYHECMVCQNPSFLLQKSPIKETIFCKIDLQLCICLTCIMNAWYVFCVVVCCNVLQCVAVCCSVLQRVAA